MVAVVVLVKIVVDAGTVEVIPIVVDEVIVVVTVVLDESGTTSDLKTRYFFNIVV